MDIIKLGGRGYASNTFVLVSGLEAAVIDPSADISEIAASVGNADLKYILLTHGHFDHIMTLDALRLATGAKVFIHREDSNMLSDAELNGSEFFGLDFSASAPDGLLDNGDVLPLGNESILVISTPGHTQGSVCYDCGNDLICGDTLFSSGYGRYDLPGGDPKALFASLSMLASRKDDPMIHPGHGASCNLSSASIIATIRHN